MNFQKKRGGPGKKEDDADFDGKQKIKLWQNLKYLFLFFMMTIFLTHLATAITITPAQFFVPSKDINSSTTDAITFDPMIGLEKGEQPKTVSFRVSENYSYFVTMSSRTKIVSFEDGEKITLRHLDRLPPGENNIEIDVLENRKPIQNSLNDKILIKIIVPDRNSAKYMPNASGIKSSKNQEGTQENEMEIIIFIGAIATTIFIISITIILMKFILERKDKIRNRKNHILKRNEDEEIASIIKEIERISEKIKKMERESPENK